MSTVGRPLDRQAHGRQRYPVGVSLPIHPADRVGPGVLQRQPEMGMRIEVLDGSGGHRSPGLPLLAILLESAAAGNPADGTSTVNQARW